MKPFRAIIMEQEETYKYRISSIENINTEDYIAKIRLALGRIGLISIEKGGMTIMPRKQEQENIPMYPLTTRYYVKVDMKNPITTKHAVQLIALITRIPENQIAFTDMDGNMVVDGAETEQHAFPQEVDSKEAQKDVGDARAKELVSDLMKDIMKKRDAVKPFTLKEGSVATHIEVSSIIGKKVDRGFYIVEQFENGTGEIFGPYRKCPENYDFISNIFHADVINESNDDGVTSFKIGGMRDSDEGMDDPKGFDKKYDVELVNQDTGGHHRVVVRASSPQDARHEAVELIAAKTKQPRERFLPLYPKID